jgi:hypothetical protein
MIFFFISTTVAKRYNPYGSDWAFGFYFGGTSFFGDIKTDAGINSTPFTKYFYDDMRMMYGISLDKWFGPYIGVTGNIQYGKIQGSKETSNAWFEANLFEYNLSLSLNLSNIFLDLSRRRNWMAYSSIGIGSTESRSWKYRISDDVLIGTNGFGKPKEKGGKFVPMTETVIPVALGVKFFVGGNVSINIAGSFHIINSDKLDATPNDNTSTIAAVEGYTFYRVGVQYWFGGNGHHVTNHYKRKARYNGGRSGYVTINSRKTSRTNNKIFKRKKKNYKFKKR